MVPFGVLIFALGKMFVGILQRVRECAKTEETPLRQIQSSDFPGSLCPGVISEGCFFAFSFESCGLVSKMMKGW